MSDAVLVLGSGSIERRVALGEYLDAEREERAIADTHAWIKRVRLLMVDGQPLRRRFTFRGDSLWWFAELYLHKQQTILDLFRTVSALEHLIERERPLEMRVASGDRIVRGLTPRVAQERQIRCRDPEGFGAESPRLARLDLRARLLTAAAMASRLRPRVVPAVQARTPIAAFVHRAFWRSGADDGSAESYIGPVLQALERRFPQDGVRYVGVGPAANFRARRWWHALLPADVDARVIPIETFAPWRALRASRQVWRQRHGWRRALWHSTDLQRHAIIGGYDCWPIVREELAGIALLQWPWSARAMDEAAAALDVLRPRVALTYAEAGGWGRALLLECRRRGIPSAGLQHGFIHRHWLNYLHEPDEMAGDPAQAEDGGFPRPSVTLLFDKYASSHLETAGHFPPGTLALTGSPRLDALVTAAGSLTPDAIARARDQAGATASRTLLLLVTKYREARQVLPALVAAIAAMPDVQLAIKTHPAETPELYRAIAGDQPNVRVLPAATPLGPLLRASRAVVTVNSTVALDAAVLGIPALVVGLPNNLTPFVDAGVMAGAATDAEIIPALRRILYDEGLRRQLERDRSGFLTRFGIGSDGRAADRAADAIAGLMEADTGPRIDVG
jgi:hypothetical protein